MGNPLTESGLKAVLTKHKIKDNGLQKALAAYAKLDDNAHDDCLSGIAQVSKLAEALKKSKEVKSNDDVTDYLDEVLAAASSEEKDVEKEKSAAAKVDAANQKKAQKEEKDKEEEEGEEEGEEEEEEEEQGGYGERLMTAFKKLKTMNGKPFEFIVCDARPLPAIMVAKRVTPKHKEELTEISGGSRKFLKKGYCYFADDHYVLEMAQSVPGLARKVQKAIKNHTGKKLKFSHGGETAGDDEEQEQPEAEDAQPGGENPRRGRGDVAPDAGNAAPPSGNDAPPYGNDAGTPPEAAPKPQRPGRGEVPQDATNPDQKPGDDPNADPADPPPNMTAPFSMKASVGSGGKNSQEDVQAVQVALNKRAKAGLKVDGQCGPKTIAAIKAFQKSLGQPTPDGRIDPGRGTALALEKGAPSGPSPEEPKPVKPPELGKAELSKAPAVWHGTRDILKTNIEALKKGVRGHYGTEHPEVIKEIDKSLGKLDGILGKLDTRLSDSLKKAHDAAGDAARKAELKNSKAILTEYLKYVKTEPMIAHIDSNPFGVDTQLKKVIVDSLTHMAKSIGT
jgi:peptidoglycan hydrolase-like protein with peptidoglycan-binding domain